MQISKEVWIPWVQKGVSVVFILAGAWLLTRIARRLLRRLRTYTVRVMDRRGSASTIELENRAATIIAVLGKLASTVIWIVALVMALSQLDFHIEPLLAGLGVAGIAVGLGAQTLIKDWLGGLFLLLEDQIR
ncbi:MAG: mechanosensitive ion channel protein MscS, partial [Acidobacteria bacterium]